MRTILSLLFSILLLSSYGQYYGGSTSRICGTYKANPSDTSKWYTTDSVTSLIKTTKRDWVYSEWQRQYSNLLFVDAVYRPCGNSPEPIVYVQKRICRLTFVVQERTAILTYSYVPPPVSLFDSIKHQFDSLKQKDTGYHGNILFFGDRNTPTLTISSTATGVLLNGQSFPSVGLGTITLTGSKPIQKKSKPKHKPKHHSNPFNSTFSPIITNGRIPHK